MSKSYIYGIRVNAIISNMHIYFTTLFISLNIQFFYCLFGSFKHLLLLILQWLSVCTKVSGFIGRNGRINNIYTLPPNQLWYFGSRDTAASVLSIRKPRTAVIIWVGLHSTCCLHYFNIYIIYIFFVQTHICERVRILLSILYIFVCIFICIFS